MCVCLCVCSAGRKVPNVIVDKKGDSDDDDDDATAGEEKDGFLGRGDEGDDPLPQPKPTSQQEDVNGEGDGDEDHGQLLFYLSYISARFNIRIVSSWTPFWDVRLWKLLWPWKPG